MREAMGDVLRLYRHFRDCELLESLRERNSRRDKHEEIEPPEHGMPQAVMPALPLGCPDEG
jgi:hypothetical protein